MQFLVGIFLATDFHTTLLDFGETAAVAIQVIQKVAILVNMLFNLRFGCQLCAGFYQIYSTIFIVFYLCTFASPNFLILVNLAILSNQTNRFMYTLGKSCFNEKNFTSTVSN